MPGAAVPDSPVALVTGASRGIGAAIARRLAAGGARVVVAARGVEACETLAAELRAGGGETWALALDVTDAAACAGAAEAVERLVGAPVDWLVNNAGIAQSAPIARTDDALFAKHLDVNLHGPRRLAAAVLPSMLERGAGRVVSVASSAGLTGYPYVAAYTASKHALVGWTRAAAAELAGKGVAVAAVCPHYVESPMLDASIANVVAKTGQSEAEARAFFESQNPGGKLVTPEQVAGAVWTLLTEPAEAANGALLELDGATERRLR